MRDLFRKLNLRDFRSKYRKIVNLVAMIVVLALCQL